MPASGHPICRRLICPAPGAGHLECLGDDPTHIRHHAFRGDVSVIERVTTDALACPRAERDPAQPWFATP